MSLTGTVTVSPTAPRDVLPRLLHEFAQPLSALQCSVELALCEEPNVARYHHALETTLEIAERLSERLAYFRDLSEAVVPCDCLRPLNAADTVAGVLHELSDLATSLDLKIAVNVEAVPVYGNGEKLHFALLRLFDAIFQSGGAARVDLICKQRRVGDIRFQTTCALGAPISPHALELVQAALATMGSELHVTVQNGALIATISLSSYCCTEAKTAVLIGDF